jgi:hypothetical protein
LKRLRELAFRRGVVGSSRAWLGVWGTITTVRLVKRLATPKPVVERFTLKPGETLVISDLGESEPV